MRWSRARATASGQEHEPADVGREPRPLHWSSGHASALWRKLLASDLRSVPCALHLVPCASSLHVGQAEEEEEEEEEDEEEEEGAEDDEEGEEEDEQGGSDDSGGVFDDVESDDGDGGHVDLSRAAGLPPTLSQNLSAGSARPLPGLPVPPTSGSGGRGLKRLVPDKEQDEIMNEIFRDLVPRKRRRRRKRKVTARRGLVLPADVEAMLGEANTEYAYGNFDQAREKLLEVIRMCPSCPDAYTTLGLIHDERQEAAKAHNLSIVPSSLT
jgi:hypothetical protein